MPLLEFEEELGKKRAAHLLRRATFGATKQQIDDFAGRTPANAINELFRQSLAPEPPSPVDLKTGSEWFRSGTTDANSGGRRLQEYFMGWFIGQMMHPDLAHSAREKVVLFLHTHFPVLREKVTDSRALFF